MSPTLPQLLVAALTALGTALGAVLGAAPVTGAVPHVQRPDDLPSPSHRVAWLNAWADHHTAPDGDRPDALSGTARMRLVVDHLRRTEADVGVLAEVELPQREAFDADAGGEFGQVQTPDALDDVVVYRKSAFSLVSADTFTLYYQRGVKVRTPVVVLSERVTGREVAVIPVHFPATTPGVGDQRRWRRTDTSLVAEQVRRLHVPVIVAGDFNAREQALCDLTGPAAQLASALASHAECHRLGTPPIDQAFFTPTLAVHDYQVHRGRSVSEATDHGAFYDAEFTLTPRA